MVQQPQRDPQEAYPGKDLGSRDFVATDEILSNYYEGLQIDPAWYTDRSPYGSTVAPSMTLTAVDGGFPGAGFKNNFGDSMDAAGVGLLQADSTGRALQGPLEGRRRLRAPEPHPS